jgi:hypothetical protein
VARPRGPGLPPGAASKKGKRVGRWTVAIGTPANPTPVGRFAVSEVVRQANPGGFFGTYIITISAHSENLSEFDGGDGRVALHGTNRASLLGQAVSHGCVRLSNPVATRLAQSVPPGRPARHRELAGPLVPCRGPARNGRRGMDRMIAPASPSVTRSGAGAGGRRAYLTAPARRPWTK